MTLLEMITNVLSTPLPYAVAEELDGAEGAEGCAFLPAEMWLTWSPMK